MHALFSKNNVVKRIEAATGAGTAAIASDIVDTAGFDGVALIVASQTVASSGTATITASEGDESNLSDEAVVTGLSLAVTEDDDNEVFVLDYAKPAHRYVRFDITRATANSAWSEMFVVLYRAHRAPVTQTANVDAVTN